MYNRNKSGPRMDCWGTLQFYKRLSDKDPLNECVKNTSFKIGVEHVKGIGL